MLRPTGCSCANPFAIGSIHRSASSPGEDMARVFQRSIASALRELVERTQPQSHLTHHSVPPQSISRGAFPQNGHGSSVGSLSSAMATVLFGASIFVNHLVHEIDTFVANARHWSLDDTFNFVLRLAAEMAK